MPDVNWLGVCVALAVLVGPFVPIWLTSRAEAKALARGQVEPSAEEWVLRVLTVLAILLLLFAPLAIIVLVFSIWPPEV